MENESEQQSAAMNGEVVVPTVVSAPPSDAPTAAPPTKPSRRRPLITALVTHWTRPTSSAREMNWAPLWRAYGVHWAGGLLALAVILLLGAYESYRPEAGRTYIDTSRWLLGEVIEEFEERPWESAGITALIVASVEA